MPRDALMTLLQATVTKTATFQGAAYDFLARPPIAKNLWARVIYTAAQNASGSNTVTFTLEGSTDNVNWNAINGADFSKIVTLSTTAQQGEVFLPLDAGPGMRYVRLVATFAGAGTSPTITYTGDFVLGAP